MVQANLERVDEHGMSPSYAPSTPFEASTAGKIACAELERLRKFHPDKFVVGSVDVGSTFAHGARVIESVSQQRRGKLIFLRCLDACGHLPFHSGLLVAHSRSWTERNRYSSVDLEALRKRCLATAMMGALHGGRIEYSCES